MKRRGLGLLLLLLLTLSLLSLSSQAVRWRAQVIALKLTGDLPEPTWSQLLVLLTPPHYIEGIVKTRNPYLSVKNPYTSLSDVDAGETLFRARCSGCHGLKGAGGTAPNLVERHFVHASNDWSLFLTIVNGIPGSTMGGQNLSPAAAWQIASYVRRLSRGVDGVGSAAGIQISEVEGIFRPVSSKRLRAAEAEPENWLMYSGTYDSKRFSSLRQITRGNVGTMKLQWVHQMPTVENLVETTPLVIDEIMYLTEPPNNVMAIDTKSGGLLWTYKRNLPAKLSLCCGRVNRGLAASGDKLYLGTLDAHLVALDPRTGKVVWDTTIEDFRSGYTVTSAPLAVNDKIIVGIAGGEYGVRGFLDCYDGNTGKRVWRFYTVPEPGQPGHDTWTGESWRTGGAPTWLTGSFDPELNLIYWGVGNASPAFNGDTRHGDNLYSNSVIALDADSGTLRWHFQFSPHDEHDWDAVQVPILADLEHEGRQRKLMLWANRNAFYYILDRTDGKFLSAKEFAKQTWAERIDSTGRPVVKPNGRPSPKGTLVFPSVIGATNWWSPSLSPETNLVYVPVLEKAGVFFKGVAEFIRGEMFNGSAFQPILEQKHYTAVRALSASTGGLVWEHRRPARETWSIMGGILSTAGDVVFGGDDDMFFALDARTGSEIWRVQIGNIVTAPITYLSAGRQQVAIAAGRAVFAFGLSGP